MEGGKTKPVLIPIRIDIDEDAPPVGNGEVENLVRSGVVDVEIVEQGIDDVVKLDNCGGDDNEFDDMDSSEDELYDTTINENSGSDVARVGGNVDAVDDWWSIDEENNQFEEDRQYVLKDSNELRSLDKPENEVEYEATNSFPIAEDSESIKYYVYVEMKFPNQATCREHLVNYSRVNGYNLKRNYRRELVNMIQRAKKSNDSATPTPTIAVSSTKVESQPTQASHVGPSISIGGSLTNSFSSGKGNKDKRQRQGNKDNGQRLSKHISWGSRSLPYSLNPISLSLSLSLSPPIYLSLYHSPISIYLLGPKLPIIIIIITKIIFKGRFFSSLKKSDSSSNNNSLDGSSNSPRSFSSNSPIRSDKKKPQSAPKEEHHHHHHPNPQVVAAGGGGAAALTGRFESSWGPSGGLRSSDVCTPETSYDCDNPKVSESPRFQAILRVTSAPRKKFPADIKSFSHELNSKGVWPFPFWKHRGLNNLEEILVLIRAKFDKAKEEVNSDLAIFAADLVGILEKNVDTHPEWQETIEDLLILARSCAMTSPADFWLQCEGIFEELDDRCQELPPGTLKQLHTRMLFILTRCTRLLQFHKESGLAEDEHVLHLRQSRIAFCRKTNSS
ncbi:uncharacterized protein LOC125422684 [Ziziphus jujuba]|uniref:Uncharacterized protein LOC125422684 n=1 Tax=Ziziphus jujuba TaxID=326968 RepID=A0ABM4A2S8_ZIZJJ|nr:uncharacterized protein LOC125422684 [Ziziphus jujuba]